MSPLKSRVVMITGASSGIGAALAREFAARGADLVLVARRGDRLRALEKELGKFDGRALVAVGDVTVDGDLEAAAAEARRAFGRLDIVVANAGFGINSRAEDLGIGDYRRQFETNVFGVLRTFYATIGDLKKTRGSFVIMGSVSGHVGTPTTSPYVMSKFAVRGLADSLRAELKRDGVAVTLISPGFIRSEIRKVDNQGRMREGAPDPIPAWLQMPADKAARKMVGAILRRRRERVVTVHGKVAVWFQRFFPWFVAWALGRSAVKTRAEMLNRDCK